MHWGGGGRRAARGRRLRWAQRLSRAAQSCSARRCPGTAGSGGGTCSPSSWLGAWGGLEVPSSSSASPPAQPWLEPALAAWVRLCPERTGPGAGPRQRWDGPQEGGERGPAHLWPGSAPPRPARRVSFPWSRNVTPPWPRPLACAASGPAPGAARVDGACSRLSRLCRCPSPLPRPGGVLWQGRWSRQGGAPQPRTLRMPRDGPACGFLPPPGPWAPEGNLWGGKDSTCSPTPRPVLVCGWRSRKYPGHAPSA